MKVNSYVRNGNVVFSNFIVIKRSEHHYGVYEKLFMDKPDLGSEITHGETLHDACKKAKLLQIGYNVSKNYFYF